MADFSPPPPPPDDDEIPDVPAPPEEDEEDVEEDLGATVKANPDLIPRPPTKSGGGSIAKPNHKPSVAKTKPVTKPKPPPVKDPDASSDEDTIPVKKKPFVANAKSNHRPQDDDDDPPPPPPVDDFDPDAGDEEETARDERALEEARQKTAEFEAKVAESEEIEAQLRGKSKKPKDLAGKKKSKKQQEIDKWATPAYARMKPHTQPKVKKDYVVGDKVEVQKADGQWIKGKVKAVFPDKVHVVFNIDGEKVEAEMLLSSLG